MRFRVELYGTFRALFKDYDPAQGVELNTGENFTVADLLLKLGIEPSSTLIIINGNVTRAGSLASIREGDTVKIFPLVGGG